jgi:hypothetical protein
MRVPPDFARCVCCRGSSRGQGLALALACVGLTSVTLYYLAMTIGAPPDAAVLSEARPAEQRAGHDSSTPVELQRPQELSGLAAHVNDCAVQHEPTWAPPPEAPWYSLYWCVCWRRGTLRDGNS